MSAEACTVKMYTQRREELKEILLTGADFVPVAGTLKSVAEAESALDYLETAATLIPGGLIAGKIFKAARAALKNGDVAEASKLINKASDEIEVVATNSGGKNNWNSESNKPKPKKAYSVDGNKLFKTDSQGKTTSVQSTLSWSKNDRNTYQQCKAGKCGIDGDEGGHLIASIFNGPGEKINLVPMNGNLNKGAWKKMENYWANALKDGKKVAVKIEPSYSGSNKIPDSFTVTYQINDERPMREVFNNTPGGK